MSNETECKPPNKWLDKDTCVPPSKCTCVDDEGNEIEVSLDWLPVMVQLSSLVSLKCIKCRGTSKHLVLNGLGHCYCKI